LGIGLYVLAKQTNNGWYLEHDQELWSRVLSELDSNNMLDQIMPKSNPEYLISGYAYTHAQKTKNACIVKAEIGTLQKSLLVVGDRYWIDNKPSKPKEFSKLSVSWANAFGGTTYEKNPAGKGIDKVLLDDIEAIPLPNIENPKQQISSPSDRPEPASFGPVGPNHPSRLCMLGTYSEEWFKYDFPGFLPDMNPRIFNTAPDDQQWSKIRAIPDRTTFKIWNMHPEKACWEGTLPALTARAFFKKEEKDALLQEIDDITCSTAWFLPERESVILMFHGSIAIDDEDADDIASIMGAAELRGHQRPIEHFEEVYTLRIDPERALDYITDDSQLISADLVGPDDEAEDYSPDKNKLSNRIDKFLQAQEQETSKTLDKYGFKESNFYDDFVGPELDLSRMTDQEQIAYFEQVNIAADEQLKEIISQVKIENPRSADMLNDIEKTLLASSSAETLKIPLSGPPDLTHFDLPVDETMGSIQEQEKFTKQKQRLKGYARKSYLYTVQYQIAAPRVSSEKNQALRQEVLLRYNQNKDLTKMDLTGADLSGLTLDDADFSESFLENAFFLNSHLRNVNFSEAVLSRSHFINCTLENITFKKSNLAETKMEKCKISKSQFTETEIENTHFFESFIEKCKFELITPTKSVWSHTQFKECLFDMCILSKGDMQHTSFIHTDLFKVVFESMAMQKTRFNNSHLKDSVFSSSTCEDCSFNESTLTNVMFEEDSPVLNCRFLASYLHECNFMETKLDSIYFIKSNLTGSDFTKAQMRNCNFDNVVARDAIFYKSDLTGSSFRSANLIQATLEKANLTDCDFSNATLFRTNVSKVTLSPETKLDGAFRDQLEIYPIYRDRLNAIALFTNE